MVLTGQQGPSDKPDIASDDEGNTAFYRVMFTVNEYATDEMIWTWMDAGIPELIFMRWNSSHGTIEMLYNRLAYNITLCNFFLDQVEGQTDETTVRQRAEARFLRALYYYYYMDLFGKAPFKEHFSEELPVEKNRADLFAYIESELDAIENDMYEPGKAPYGRADRAANWLLRARMNLNAEVYTGTARWADAKTAAEAVIAMGYKLCPNYEELFMQDNTENLNARNEFIFAIAYDRDKTQSYGGTTALINASLGEDANNGIAAALGYPAGTKISRDQWNGYHVPNEYVANFDLVGVDWEATSGFGYNREKSDRRAFFYNIGGVEAYDKANVNSGWRCWKFNSRASDGTLYSTDNYSIFSSADFPMFRLAEMYLIYAEAQARLDGGTTTDSKAMGYIKELRDRAGMTTPSSINLDFILKERACELMWEGHRRTDLIRYGYFTAMSFPWPYKGGIPDGKVALPSYRTVYPLLQSDLSENSNLVQNTGYQSNN